MPARRIRHQFVIISGVIRGSRSKLAPVYGWFTEGFDMLDLKEAKALPIHEGAQCNDFPVMPAFPRTTFSNEAAARSQTCSLFS